jgi:hypothetical protein
MGAVRTISELLPADQVASAEVARELRALALEARPYVDEAHRQQIDASLPPAEIALVSASDLPASVARPFTERDGTRGRLLFVEHADGRDLYDGRYMITWAEAVRSARTASGETPAIGGGAVVFADLLTTIFEDGPRAIAASLLATMLVLVLAFRRMRERALALGSMLVGVVTMVGVLAALSVKLNFLNMVALPITFGIGTEYGVNFVKRFLEERQAGAEGVEQAVQRTLEGAGGAVVLCSLTTLIGYISLYASANRALNSFGLAMSVGEITCLVASLVALPALLVVGARWRGLVSERALRRAQAARCGSGRLALGERAREDRDGEIGLLDVADQGAAVRLALRERAQRGPLARLGDERVVEACAARVSPHPIDEEVEARARRGGLGLGGFAEEAELPLDEAHERTSAVADIERVSACALARVGRDGLVVVR